jgi:peptidoglycan pentaglycine glycine transferase (the first glycine)
MLNNERFSNFVELEEKPYTDEDAEWDAFVAQHPNGSTLQTTQWARLKNRFGWRARRVWLRREGRMVAGAQILIRSAALGLMRIAYIPHGPLVDWFDEGQVSVLLNQIDFAAFEARAGMLKMEPLIWQDDLPPADWESLCARHGCLPNADTIQPPRTLIVDLTKSDEEILSAMKQKTRYNIRLAKKKGVVTRLGTISDLPIFTQLISETGHRNQFGVHKPAYYMAAYELFSPDKVALFIAEFDSQPLSAIMVFTNGTKAAYLYGASSDLERQRMPSYAVQWSAMKWAKESGCTEYDLWGVPDYSSDQLEAQFQNRSDGLWGVYRFKRGFGGALKRTVGTADRIYNNLVYRLYRWRRG